MTLRTAQHLFALPSCNLPLYFCYNHSHILQAPKNDWKAGLQGYFISRSLPSSTPPAFSKPGRRCWVVCSPPQVTFTGADDTRVYFWGWRCHSAHPHFTARLWNFSGGAPVLLWPSAGSHPGCVYYCPTTGGVPPRLLPPSLCTYGEEPSASFRGWIVQPLSRTAPKAPWRQRSATCPNLPLPSGLCPSSELSSRNGKSQLSSTPEHRGDFVGGQHQGSGKFSGQLHLQIFNFSNFHIYEMRLSQARTSKYLSLPWKWILGLLIFILFKVAQSLCWHFSRLQKQQLVTELWSFFPSKLG